MNSAYKHLDSKLRLAELSVGQWLGVVIGVGLGIVWGVYVSPFGSYVSLASAIYVGAIPAGAAVFASITEFDLWLLIRSALAWRRMEGRFIAGAGDSIQGYVLREDADTRAARTSDSHALQLDLAALWEEV